MSEDDDHPLKALLKRVSEGNETARQELYDLHARKFEGLTKYWLSQGGCWDRDVHGREISQSLWAVIFSKPERLSSVECFVAWAQTILRNLVLQHVSGPKGCKKAPLQIDELDLGRALPVAAIIPGHVTSESSVLWNEILEEAERIRPEFRQILVLHLVEGFSHDEIASRLSITPVSVRLIYSRGLKKLKAFLGARETMVRQGPLQLRPEPARGPSNTSPPVTADFRHELNGPLQSAEREKSGLSARTPRTPQSRRGVKEKEERLSAYRRRKGRRSPNDGSGTRRTR